MEFLLQSRHTLTQPDYQITTTLLGQQQERDMTIQLDHQIMTTRRHRQTMTIQLSSLITTTLLDQQQERGMTIQLDHQITTIQLLHKTMTIQLSNLHLRVRIISMPSTEFHPSQVLWVKK